MKNPLRELPQQRRLDPPFHGRQILLARAVARMGQAQAELAVIRQQNQPLTVVIQPSDRMQMPPLLGQQFINRGPVVLIRLRAHEPRRLVQSQIGLPARANRLAIHRHPVARRLYLGPQRPHRLAVDRDPAREHDLLARAPRGDPRLREKFLQPDHAFLKTRKARPRRKPPRAGP